MESVCCGSDPFIPLVLSIMLWEIQFSAIMGMFNTASGLGGILQVVVSLIYDFIGTYYPAWIIMSTLCIVNIGIFVVCIKPLKR